MPYLILFVLAILPRALPASTIATNKLFHNTIKRWSIDISSGHDLNQRWKRFVKAKESVDRTTRGATLDSLNLFTVLNDAEYEVNVGPLKRRLNSSSLILEDFMADEPVQELTKRADVDVPDTYNYWEDTVGMNPPMDQLGCGSCWSFPNVATMEALYKEQTGETVSFSQQYFVDCSTDGNGCAGGAVKQGYRLTMMRQYLMSQDDWPYTGYYQECQFADDIATFTNNALQKLWVTSFRKTGANDNGMVSGLLYSPVAFGSLVSNDIFDYSGGVWTDDSCGTDPNPHAMLLVGYTETTLRVQNSYGTGWGEGGYANYERYSNNLAGCSFFSTAYYLTVTFRRELEYEWCNKKKLSTRGDCSTSCADMNTDTETGWTLAVIPTKYHNTLVVDMINAVYPGVKSDDKFTYLWIGLTDMEKTGDYNWVDGFTPVNYRNTTGDTAKYGMINKNTGGWKFKNSLKYKLRGLCSRAVTCWDIGTAVQNGQVTFDGDTLIEGTVATAVCDEGYVLEGAATLTCAGGEWSADLPTCTLYSELL